MDLTTAPAKRADEALRRHDVEEGGCAYAASQWRLPPELSMPRQTVYRCESCKTQAWILDLTPAQQQQQPQKKDGK